MTDEEWMEKVRAGSYPWMSDDQWECFRMLSDLMYGAHHICGKVKPAGTGIEVSLWQGGWSTFDFDGLTRAVVMGHDRMIRVEVSPSGPGRIRFMFHKRHTREGSMSKRHPTIEQAIESIRGKQAQ